MANGTSQKTARIMIRMTALVGWGYQGVRFELACQFRQRPCRGWQREIELLIVKGDTAVTILQKYCVFDANDSERLESLSTPHGCIFVTRAVPAPEELGSRSAIGSKHNLSFARPLQKD